MREPQQSAVLLAVKMWHGQSGLYSNRSEAEDDSLAHLGGVVVPLPWPADRQLPC